MAIGAKKTVLEYVQSCLTAMGSDSVESIDPLNGGTQEAYDVAVLFKDTYSEFQTRQDWEWMTKPFAVTQPDQVNKPTEFLIPDYISSIQYVAYDTSVDGTEPKIKQLTYLEPKDFLIDQRSAGSNRRLVSSNGYRYYVGTNQDPTTYTIFGNVLVLNSYNSSKNPNGCEISWLEITGQWMEELELTDNFTPSVPLAVVQALQTALNQAAYIYLLQQDSPIDAKRENRQIGALSYRDGLVARNKAFFKKRFGRHGRGRL